MKTSEFHKLVQQNGWTPIRQAGSHVIYEKNGVTKSVPYHGSKEMPKGIERTLRKQMGL